MAEIADILRGGGEKRPRFNDDEIKLMVLLPLSAFDSSRRSSRHQQASLETDKTTAIPPPTNMKAPSVRTAMAEKLAAQQLAHLRRTRSASHMMRENKELRGTKQLVDPDEQSRGGASSDLPQSLSTADSQASEAGSSTSPTRRRQATERQRYAQTLDMDVEEGMKTRYRPLAEFYS